MRKIAAIALLAIAMMLVGCTAESAATSQSQVTSEKNDKKEVYDRSEFVVGTIVSVRLFEDGSESVLDEIFDRLTEIENKMSFNSTESEVIHINGEAGMHEVSVSEDTYNVIASAVDFAEKSSGMFDPTIGPLVDLWGIGSEGAAVPSDSDRMEALDLIDWNDVVLNETDKSVFLTKKNMKIDLGAIAKGYASDEIVRILKENGVERAIINLGGNVYAYGEKIDGSAWRIGIQNPFSTRGEYIGIIDLKNKSVVTSGIYERYFEFEGKQYHHILDTSTGYPVENDLASVTIISENSMNADAMSTILFAEGIEGGLAFIETYYPEVDAVFVTKDKRVYTTDLSEYGVEWTDDAFIIK